MVEKIFSKIDLNDAYLRIPAEEESSKLLCINRQCGLYKFERLPLPVIFQQVIDTTLSSFVFSVAYLDDILVNSKSVVEHKDHIHQVFAKIQDYGSKIKETKGDFFFMENIKYLGHIIDKDDRRL